MSLLASGVGCPPAPQVGPRTDPRVDGPPGAYDCASGLERRRPGTVGVERWGERAPLTGGETEAQRGTEVCSGAPSRSKAIEDGGRGREHLPAPGRPILSAHPGDDRRRRLWDLPGPAWAV